MRVISRYQKRISGPLLDRVGIHIEVPRVEYDKLSDYRFGEPSAAIPELHLSARAYLCILSPSTMLVVHLPRGASSSWPAQSPAYPGLHPSRHHIWPRRSSIGREGRCRGIPPHSHLVQLNVGLFTLPREPIARRRRARCVSRLAPRLVAQFRLLRSQRTGRHCRAAQVVAE